MSRRSTFKTYLQHEIDSYCFHLLCRNTTSTFSNEFNRDQVNSAPPVPKILRRQDAPHHHSNSTRVASQHTKARDHNERQLQYEAVRKTIFTTDNHEHLIKNSSLSKHAITVDSKTNSNSISRGTKTSQLHPLVQELTQGRTKSSAGKNIGKQVRYTSANKPQQEATHRSQYDPDFDRSLHHHIPPEPYQSDELLEESEDARTNDPTVLSEDRYDEEFPALGK